jgi:hypothetical protein
VFMSAILTVTGLTGRVSGSRRSLHSRLRLGRE